MTETDRHPRLMPLGADSATYKLPALARIQPGAYAAPARFLHLDHDQELDQLCQLAGELLQDPLAVDQLRDRVLELLQQDLQRQQERSGGYGRRW